MSRPTISPMISHVSVGVADLARAGQFYDAVLTPLGFRRVMQGVWGIAWGDKFPTFWAQQPFDRQAPSPGNGVHVCFNAPDKASVEAFHAAGVKAGGVCDGPPGLRTLYTPNYYAAFLRDPDGNKIEALCFLSEADLAQA
ncbi:MAG: VOC family protein [Rhodospirillaceae bacterium]|nr:VOC family protein [Rhodospirillaceae bacterium]